MLYKTRIINLIYKVGASLRIKSMGYGTKQPELKSLFDLSQIT